MNSLQYKLRCAKIKFLSWEYWPQAIVYFPANMYYVWLSIKARSFFFFSASNPSIETGGMFFESKWDIFKLIPKSIFPKTIYIEPSETIDSIEAKFELEKLQFPIIAKPDRGERGWKVKKLYSRQDLIAYRNEMHVSFLLQTFSNYPLEFSIFYVRHPEKKTGTITSVTLKKLLSVTGDGVSTLQQLIEQNDRAYLQWNTLKKDDAFNFNEIIPNHKEVELVPYGNHVRGAMFLDYCHIIDAELTSTFDTICNQIEGFYFGRFDLKASSIEELKQGKLISIVELNGAGAEPGHIYQPGFSYLKAQQVIMQHFKLMFDIAMANKHRGHSFMTLMQYKEQKRLERRYKNNVV